jgi:DNA-binding response OmpR family regulator
MKVLKLQRKKYPKIAFILEDDETTVKILNSRLQSLGYKTHEFNNLNSLKEKLTTYKPDIFLIDINLGLPQVDLTAQVVVFD